MSKSLVVSLIGRPNVGKSTIFNRLMKNSKKAMTYDRPGVTRDRHYGIASFDELNNEEEVKAILVDTGGFYPEEVDEREVQRKGNDVRAFFNVMRDHAKLAIEESDLVLLVVDAREGLNPHDEMIMSHIRKAGKECWVLVNKYDSDKQEGDQYTFYSLGLNDNELYALSAEHGIGLEGLRKDLQQHIIACSKRVSVQDDLQKGITPKERVIANVAIIGAPNAGKSTLLNELLGAKRALVSPVAGTTIDPIEGYFDLFMGNDVQYLRTEGKTYKSDYTLALQYEQFLKEFGPTLVKEGSAEFEDEFTEEYRNEIDQLESGFTFAQDEESDSEQQTEGVDANQSDLPSSPEELEAKTAELFADEAEDCAEVEESIETVEVAGEEIEEAATEEVEEKDTNYWRSVRIVDTAGVRKNKLVSGPIETQAVYRSLKAITEAQIVILMIDATKGFTHQDRRLADIALERGCSMIVCLNKMDLLKEQLKDPKDRKEWLLDLEAQVPWLSFCKLLPMSAKYRKNIGGLKKSLKETVLVRHKEISTGRLNRTVSSMMERHSITVKGLGAGRSLRVKYASMIKNNPPTFLMFSNRSKNIPDNYKRYLKKGIRDEFKLVNTPIHLIFRTSKELDARLKKVTSQQHN